MKRMNNLIGVLFITLLILSGAKGTIQAQEKEGAITIKQYTLLLAKNHPKSPVMPANASSLNDDELFREIKGRLSSKGVLLKGTSPESPLSRSDHVNLTYAFITGEKGKDFGSNKFILQSKGIIDSKDIGVVTAIEGSVYIYRNGEKMLLTGPETIYPSDIIETEPDAKVEIMFDDGSRLTIGKDSAVEIEEFEYNPVKNIRNTLLIINKGELRLKVAWSEEEAESEPDFKVRTPVALINVKKSEVSKADFLVFVSEGGKTKVVTVEGQVGVKPLLAAKVDKEDAGGSSKTSEEQSDSEKTSDSSAQEGSAAGKGSSSGSVNLSTNVSVTIGVFAEMSEPEEMDAEDLLAAIAGLEMSDDSLVGDAFVSFGDALATIDNVRDIVGVATADSENQEDEQADENQEQTDESDAEEEADIAEIIDEITEDHEDLADEIDDKENYIDTDTDGVCIDDNAKNLVLASYGSEFSGMFFGYTVAQQNCLMDSLDVSQVMTIIEAILQMENVQDYIDYWNSLTAEEISALVGTTTYSIYSYIVDSDGDGVVDNLDSDAFDSAISGIFQNLVDGKSGAEISQELQSSSGNEIVIVDTDLTGSLIFGNQTGINFQDYLITSDFPNADFTLNDAEVFGLGDDSSFQFTLPFSFNFYGNDYLSVYVNANGNLTFGSGDARAFTDGLIFLSTDPRIAPLWTDLNPYYYGEGGGSVFATIDDTGTVIKFDWKDVPYWCSNCADDYASENTNTFSAMLFSNNNIAFTYDSINGLLAGEESFYGNTLSFIAGISPGGNLSTAASGDLSGGIYTGSANEAVYEIFLDFSSFDLNYYGLLFEPNSGDSANGYTMTPYGSNILASQQTIITASQYGATQNEIDGGAFLPGNYEYGLQVGDYISTSALAAINSSAFLSYAVQVEEDHVNRAALEVYRDAVTEQDVIDTINMQLHKDDIRERDAYLAQQADAQAGRVLKNSLGQWVRSQQYLLRPDDYTVQVVNVTMNGSSGLQTMDWRTHFTGSMQGVDVRTLPWADWMAASGTSIAGTDPLYINNASGRELLSMSARFTNGSDAIKDIRTFGGLINNIQNINSQQLDVNGQVYGYIASGSLNTVANSYTLSSGLANPGQPTGFQYRINDGSGVEQQINVRFFVLGNSTNASNTGMIGGYELISYNDIWSALSTGIVNAGSTATAPSIGLNNLEIGFENNTGTSLLTAPVDLIFIPLGNMEFR